MPRNLNIDALDEQVPPDVVFTTTLTPRNRLGYNTPSQARLARRGCVSTDTHGWFGAFSEGGFRPHPTPYPY